MAERSNWRRSGVRTTRDGLECLVEARNGRGGIDYAWARRQDPVFSRLEERGFAFFTRAAAGGDFGYWRATDLGAKKLEDISAAPKAE